MLTGKCEITIYRLYVKLCVWGGEGEQWNVCCCLVAVRLSGTHIADLLNSHYLYILHDLWSFSGLPVQRYIRSAVCAFVRVMYTTERESINTHRIACTNDNDMVITLQRETGKWKQWYCVWTSRDICVETRKFNKYNHTYRTKVYLCPRHIIGLCL